MNKVNLEAKLRSFDIIFSHKIVARMNSYKIAVVAAKAKIIFQTRLRGNVLTLKMSSPRHGV